MNSLVKRHSKLFEVLHQQSVSELVQARHPHVRTVVTGAEIAQLKLTAMQSWR